MESRGVVRIGTPFRHNRFLQATCAGYGLLWTLAALSPVDRGTWLLENLLVFATVGALVATHPRFVFSNLSYGLIALFLVLHCVGSHYTYSAVPAGFALQEALGLARNPYDRIVHFAFGLLLAYPLRELVLRVLHLHGLASYAIPVVIVVALGSVYEIAESWAARLVDPAIGIAFVGAQGDVWDGQKDMTLALVGALGAMFLAAAWRRRTGHEAYLQRLRERTP